MGQKVNPIGLRVGVMLHGRIMGAPLHTVALVGQYPALINLNGKTSSPGAYSEAAMLAFARCSRMMCLYVHEHEF